MIFLIISQARRPAGQLLRERASMYVQYFPSRSYSGTEEWPRIPDMVLSITTHYDEGRKAAVEEDRVRSCGWLVSEYLTCMTRRNQSTTLALSNATVCHVRATRIRARGCMGTSGREGGIIDTTEDKSSVSKRSSASSGNAETRHPENEETHRKNIFSR